MCMRNVKMPWVPTYKGLFGDGWVLATNQPEGKIDKLKAHLVAMDQRSGNSNFFSDSQTQLYRNVNHHY